MIFRDIQEPWPLPVWAECGFQLKLDNSSNTELVILSAVQGRQADITADTGTQTGTAPHFPVAVTVLLPFEPVIATTRQSPAGNNSISPIISAPALLPLPATSCGVLTATPGLR